MTEAIATRQYEGIEIPTAGTFEIDSAHSHVGFVARHMMVSKVRGSFTDVSGEIIIAENAVESSVNVTIQAGSITTGAEQRDGHIRGGDFLEIEKYPTLTFTSTGLTLKKGDKFALQGTLTIKGVSQSVELDVEFGGVNKNPWGKEVIGFNAETEIDREDFGITWNQALETGGVLVSKKIKIEIEGEATRKEA